jgi:hypothetical protein
MACFLGVRIPTNRRQMGRLLCYLASQPVSESRTCYLDSALQNIYTYYRNRVRHGWVGSDFYHARAYQNRYIGQKLIPYSGAPAALLPEFAIGLPHYDDAWLRTQGYTPIQESANPFGDNLPCLYRREGSYSYAFSVAATDLENTTGSLPVEVTQPISSYIREYDRIAVLAKAREDANVIVTVQELAYPGWTVQVDGRPATLVSVGDQIGVLLPHHNQEHVVLFQYLPQRFFVGSAITLITALLCSLYLLRADKIIPGKPFDNAMSKVLQAWDLQNPQ